MIFFKNYLLEENQRLRERVEHLESRIDEIYDARFFNRTPDRLQPPVQKMGDSKIPNRPSDAMSVAEEDAWKRAKKPEEVDDNISANN